MAQKDKIEDETTQLLNINSIKTAPAESKQGDTASVSFPDSVHCSMAPASF